MKSLHVIEAVTTLLLLVAVLAFGALALTGVIEVRSSNQLGARGQLKPAVPPDRGLLDTQRNALGVAFNNNNAKSWAALFTEDGDYFEYDGAVYRGRPAIEKFFTKLFADNPGLQGIGGERLGERFIAPDIFLEDGRWQVGPRDGGATEVYGTYIWVFRDGRWLVQSVRVWVSHKLPDAANK